MGDDVVAVFIDELDVGERRHDVVLVFHFADIAAGGVLSEEALRVFDSNF